MHKSGINTYKELSPFYDQAERSKISFGQIEEWTVGAAFLGAYGRYYFFVILTCIWG